MIYKNILVMNIMFYDRYEQLMVVEMLMGKYWLYEYIQGNVYHDNDTSHLFDEAKLISLAKIISKYHQFLIRNSQTYSTNKKTTTTTREHLIQELKQVAVRLLSFFFHLMRFSSLLFVGFDLSM